MASILVIDDDKKIIRMLTRRLTRAGYDVYTAENGKIGIEKATEICPDLILMDMYMPVMDGYEATTRLRRQGYAGRIIALTASAMVHQANKSIEAGCDRFISKPISIDFENQLQAILEDRHGKDTDRR